MSVCEDCVRCEADGCTAVAYCLSEPGSGPCPHDRVLCEAHNLEHCPDCRLEAEQEMYRTGEWSPEADPFYLPENKAADDEVAARPPLTFPGSPGFRAGGESS